MLEETSYITSTPKWGAVDRVLVHESHNPDGFGLFHYHEHAGQRIVKVLNDKIVDNVLQPWDNDYVFNIKDDELYPYKQPIRTLKDWLPGTLIGYVKYQKKRAEDTELYTVRITKAYKKHFNGFIVGKLAHLKMHLTPKIDTTKAGVPISVRYRDCYMLDHKKRWLWAVQDDDLVYRLQRRD